MKSVKFLSILILAVLTISGCGSTKDINSSAKDSNRSSKEVEKAANTDVKNQSIETVSPKKEEPPMEKVELNVKDDLSEEKKIKVDGAQQLIDLENKHSIITKHGNIFNVKNEDELKYLFTNTKYLTITFYDNFCFARTQPSYNMIHNQPELLKRIPDMIFVNIQVEQFSDLVKKFQVNATPFTVLVNKGQAMAGSPGYYDNERLEKLMRKYLDIN